MATFNFDGNTASVFDSATASGLTISGNITDAGATPVTFSFSVSTSQTFAQLNLVDDTLPGFEITARTVGPGNPLFQDITLELGIATPTSNRTGFTMTSNPLLVINGVTQVGTVVNGGTTVQFTISPGGSNTFTIGELVTNFTCFCAGTRIATPEGAKTVEDLRPGDLVQLADGTTTPVRWLGHQNVDMGLADPSSANPIRITKGALGDSLPERDLRVSQDHAIAIDGYLINAGALVNGTTIYQERDVRDSFTYYHIETDAHELILAEGVAAETFIDYTTRDTFENADEAPDRIIPEMPMPRISSARMVPDAIQRRLRPLIAAE